jgi:hypothetical protein
MTDNAVDVDEKTGAVEMMYSINSVILDVGRIMVTDDESNNRRIRTAVVFR